MILIIGKHRLVRLWKALTAALVVALVSASCGSSEETATANATVEGDQPVLVATTSILGDVVADLVGDQFEVVTIMPPGADPHDFQASAQQVAQLSSADLVVANGGNFEEGLLDVLEAAEADGVSIFEALDAVSTLEFADEDDHDDEHEDEHADEDHADEDDHDEDEHADDEHADEDDHDEDEHDDHDHSRVDPHFFTDPSRMAMMIDALGAFIVENVDGVDVDTITSNTTASVASLNALADEVDTILEPIAAEQRVLVTNHEVFGYFAERFDFTVLGIVIPGGGTNSGVDPQSLVELAEVIEEANVPAIFVDTSASDDVAQTVASEVGDIAIVEIYSESLGPVDSDGGTYSDMVLTNATRIATALTE